MAGDKGLSPPSCNRNTDSIFIRRINGDPLHAHCVMKVALSPKLLRTFEVQHPSRPTLTHLCWQLKDVAAQVDKAPLVPLGVTVAYYVNARDRYKSATLAWHLSGPDATSTGNLVCTHLIKSGFTQPGQVVFANATKYVAINDTNSLVVQIYELDTNCTKDTKELGHKLLEWYLEDCAVRKAKPNRVAFTAILKSITNKNTKKRKLPDDLLALKNKIPDFLKNS